MRAIEEGLRVPLVLLSIAIQGLFELVQMHTQKHKRQFAQQSFALLLTTRVLMTRVQALS